MNGEPKPQTNQSTISIVVVTLSVNATIGLCVLGYCLVYKIEPNQVLLTAFVAVVNYILGVVSGILSKTSPTETTKQPQPHDSNLPLPVVVENPKTDPVNTEEAK